MGQELSDTNETLSDQTCANQAIQGAKRKLDQEMQTLGADLDEMVGEAGLSGEKAQKAMIDAARLADELRGEQELAQALEHDKKLLEAQAKEMQGRLDESELDAENRRLGDAQKNLRKSERKIKELTFQGDEDRKNHERIRPSSTNSRARSRATRSR